ncbi:hypothetical protein K438DRAFT_1782681 [Mycena galopus ATCC 62051]|nr:hypothetical protein K438DRAFT_1782681 [Mycena galopus ATCC 62051]
MIGFGNDAVRAGAWAPIQCAVEEAQPPRFQLGRQTHRGAGKERDLLENNDGFRYLGCKDSMPEYSGIHCKINTLVANSTLEGAGTFDTPHQGKPPSEFFAIFPQNFYILQDFARFSKKSKISQDLARSRKISQDLGRTSNLKSQVHEISQDLISLNFLQDLSRAGCSLFLDHFFQYLARLETNKAIGNSWTSLKILQELA